MRVTRRQLLGLALLAASGSAALVALEAARREVADARTASARRVGLAWLRAHPEEADPATLEAMLGPLPDAALEPGALRDPRVRAWLRQRMRDDFRTDRVVELEGWSLSATEARFCARLALG